MRPSTRLALLLSLATALALVLSGAARADHELGHDHPFCGQGGGQGGVSSGGPGGTLLDEAAAGHFDGGGGGDPADTTILIPRHLGERFGRDDPILPGDNPQFIEMEADDIDDIGGGGSNGGPYHGGHGGGPGGGQGGSTFLGAGDGGCNPNILEAVRRPPFIPGRRLPITGSLSEQMGLLGGLMLSLGALLWLIARRRNDELAPVSSDSTIADVKPVTTARRGYEVVSRLKEQTKGSWTSGGPRG